MIIIKDVFSNRFKYNTNNNNDNHNKIIITVVAIVKTKILLILLPRSIFSYLDTCTCDKQLNSLTFPVKYHSN